MKRMFGTARVIWATLMLALFDAAGVLVPAQQPPNAFCSGCAVQNVIFSALLVLAYYTRTHLSLSRARLW